MDMLLRPRAARRTAIALFVAASALLPCVAARAQATAQMLIGKAVSDDSQTKEIGNAILRFNQRDIDGCRAVLERARANNPKLPPPGVMMATLWLSVNQLPPARGEIEDTAVNFPGDPEPYLMLGELSLQEGRVTEAAILFDKASALTEAFAENAKRKRDFEIRSHAGAAFVAQARKQWEVAQKHIAKWLEIDPDSVGAHQRMGIVLFQLGKEQESLAEFREAKKLDEKADQPELALARLYDGAGKKDMAKKLIESAIKSAPKDAGVLRSAADWYLGQNDLETAKTIAETALTIDAKSLDSKIVRGSIARVARDYKTAEKFFNEAHVQSPGNFAASNSLALVLIESEAKEDRQRALEMAEANVAMWRENSPQQIAALTTLAWVYYKLGRREDAEGILGQIQRNNALTTDGAYYIAKILADRGERDRAKQILEEVLENAPMFATRPDAKDLLDKLKSPTPSGG